MTTARDLRSVEARPDATVGDALRRTAENRFGFVVVVGDDRKVLGTATDEMMRRALLRGADRATPIVEVMSEKIVALAPGATDADVVATLVSHRRRALPVIDDGRLVGMRSLDAFPDSGGPRPVAVIMAGGRGQRLRPLTDAVPKPLLRVGPTSIVERLIAALGRAGIEDVYLAVNYKAEAFQKRLGNGEQLGVAVHYIREKHRMGTAGALALIPEPTGPVVVSNGDIVTTLDFARLIEYHWHHRAAVTVAGIEHTSQIPYGVLHTSGHHLLRVEEKPHRRDLCSAGIYVLDPEVIRLVDGTIPFDMPDLISRALAEGLPVSTFPILEKWFDIGSRAEFERVLVQFATGENA